MKRPPASRRAPPASTKPPDEAPLELTRAHAFLAAQNAFTSFLDIPCSLVTRTGSWIVVYSSATPSVVGAHDMLGQRAARNRYNDEHVQRVLEQQELLQSELHGFSDLWVPVVSAGRCDNLLVSGPFLRRRWSADDLRRSWLSLTREKPRGTEPRLLHYARTVLRTPVLSDDELGQFEDFLRALADLLAGRGEEQEHAEKFWHQARRDFSRRPAVQLQKGALLVDPISSWTWAAGLRPWDREELGLDELPNEVLAVLPAPPSAVAEETLDLLVRAEHFQLECVELARSLPNTIATRLEDTGVLLLTHVSPKLGATQRRLQLRQRVEQVQDFVRRRFGTKALVGVGERSARIVDLHRAAQQAVFGMQLAVHREQPLCFYADEVEAEGRTPSRAAARALPAARLGNRLLSSFGRAEPAVLDVSRMDYVRGVVQESGGRASVMRVHFEHTLFALLTQIERRAQLDSKTTQDLERRLTDSLAAALTTIELITVFRQWWDTLLRVSSAPGTEARALRLERAKTFIEDNCQAELTLAQVARHAGMSRPYFSRIFKQAFGQGFEQYLTAQRLALGERLLRTSALPIGRLSLEAGFKSPAHFSAVFRKAHGVSPLVYRRREGAQAASGPR